MGKDAVLSNQERREQREREKDRERQEHQPGSAINPLSSPLCWGKTTPSLTRTRIYCRGSSSRSVPFHGELIRGRFGAAGGYCSVLIMIMMMMMMMINTKDWMPQISSGRKRECRGCGHRVDL
ncbi:hypothetical protein KQX54_020998 [Cotesia glomerata]|uniref:Uncharacterized protein n=1 Tax=Cotesia glomerata TaxID=32391 RepID=A0AAV7J624_COTGL|nr:hypothetical protein KQX54_020998 [Cotesia glomerata]